MSYNTGHLNEERLALAINNKMYDELNNNLRNLVMHAIPKFDRNKRIKCCKAEDYIKPDIVIYQEEEIRYISVKCGTAEGVHEEKLDRFTNFLKESGFDDYTIESYLLFHFGDGTTNGTGENRLTNFQVMVKYHDRIRKLNEQFNKSKDFIKFFADRVMFQGVNPLANQADILYHGDEDFGLLMSRKQFMRHIDFKSWDFMESVVHVGPFVLRPKGRYPNREIKNDFYRFTVVVSYPRLFSDIQLISKKYNF